MILLLDCERHFENPSISLPNRVHKNYLALLVSFGCVECDDQDLRLRVEVVGDLKAHLLDASETGRVVHPSMFCWGLAEHQSIVYVQNRR